MDTTNIVLTTLRDAARIAPIPYLQGAAGAALGILDIIQVWYATHFVKHLV